MTYTLQNGGTSILYAGTRTATGSWSQFTCTSSTGAVVTSRGTGKSFTIPTTGGIFCPNTPASTSLAYKVKQLYC